MRLLSMMMVKRKQAGQEGFALLEILLAALVLGIAVIGISLMLSRAQSMVVGQGDRYVALYLAQQKIEKLTAMSLTGTPPAGFNSVPTGTETTTSGCPAPGEPCYSETGLQAGEQIGTTAQTFTRTTCVNFVNDDNPTTPTTCTNCSVGGTCTNNTKRITVTVTPTSPEADPVTLVTVVTAHP